MIRRTRRGGTFGDFTLAAPVDSGDVAGSLSSLRAAVRQYKDVRLDWYVGQMQSRSRLANGVPGIAAALGVIGLLMTSAMVIARALALSGLNPWKNADVVIAAIAVVAYAAMSAVLLYERLTEGSGGYFRAVATVVAIRDLWTAYDFDEIGRSLAPASPDPAAEMERWRAPIETFCKALDGIVANELVAWQAAYQATARLRDGAADEGLRHAVIELKTSAEAAASAARADAQKAEEATRAASAARLTATLNLSLGSAVTQGSAIILLDGAEQSKGRNQRSFSISGLSQGIHHIRVEFTPSAPGSAMIAYEKAVRLEGGINTETIAVA